MFSKQKTPFLIFYSVFIFLFLFGLGFSHVCRIGTCLNIAFTSVFQFVLEVVFKRVLDSSSTVSKLLSNPSSSTHSLFKSIKSSSSGPVELANSKTNASSFNSEDVAIGNEHQIQMMQQTAANEKRVSVCVFDFVCLSVGLCALHLKET